MNEEVEVYKLFRQLEARKKRANPYKFYDKDELIDEIFKNEDEIERLNNIINNAIEYINENWRHWCSNHCKYATETINILKGSDKE